MKYKSPEPRRRRQPSHPSSGAAATDSNDNALIFRYFELTPSSKARRVAATTVGPPCGGVEGSDGDVEKDDVGGAETSAAPVGETGGTFGRYGVQPSRDTSRQMFVKHGIHLSGLAADSDSEAVRSILASVNAEYTLQWISDVICIAVFEDTSACAAALDALRDAERSDSVRLRACSVSMSPKVHADVRGSVREPGAERPTVARNLFAALEISEPEFPEDVGGGSGGEGGDGVLGSDGVSGLAGEAEVGGAALTTTATAAVPSEPVDTNKARRKKKKKKKKKKALEDSGAVSTAAMRSGEDFSHISSGRKCAYASCGMPCGMSGVDCGLCARRYCMKHR